MNTFGEHISTCKTDERKNIIIVGILTFQEEINYQNVIEFLKTFQNVQAILAYYSFSLCFKSYIISLYPQFLPLFLNTPISFLKPSKNSPIKLRFEKEKKYILNKYP